MRFDAFLSVVILMSVVATAPDAGGQAATDETGAARPAATDEAGETPAPADEASPPDPPAPPAEPLADAAPEGEDRAAELAAALAALESSEPEERLAAIRVLSDLDDPAAVVPLVEVLRTDGTDEVRRYAVIALANIGGSVAEAALHAAAESDLAPAVRAAADEALRRLSPWGAAAPAAAPSTPPSDAPPPAAPSDDPYLGAAWSAAEAVRQLASGWAANRAAAARRLGTLGDPTTGPLLADRLAAETDPAVRRQIVLSLAMIGSDFAVETVRRAAREDASPEVQAAAREALHRLGVPLFPPSAYAGGWVADEETAGGAASPPTAAPDADLFGDGDWRIGGQLALTQLWRTDTYALTVGGRETTVETETDVLSFALGPHVGYLATSWLELGLELGFSVGTAGGGNSESTAFGFAILPQARAHLRFSDHVLATFALLLGYGYESLETKTTLESGTEIDTEVSADGFVIGPEIGLEIAADHVLVPIWLRFFYHPWGLEDAATPDVEHDAEDYVVAFGTGIHAYF